MSSLPFQVQKLNNFSETLEYFVYNNKKSQKKIFINAGLHGNESGVIKPLQFFLQKNYSQLPSFTFVPKMSLSAVDLQTRQNKYEHDLNRYFGTQKDAEAVLAEKVVKKHHPYDLVLSFHEDTEYSQTYLYDVGKKSSDKPISGWQQKMKSLGIEMLNGVDDPSDPELKYKFVEGYNYLDHALANGQFEHWVVLSGLAKRSFSIEIPSKLGLEAKGRLINEYFWSLVLPCLNEC